MLDEAETDSVYDWKQKARAQFEEWLEKISEVPPAEFDDKSQIPDLNSFYRELCALRSEFRTSGRRVHETLGRFGEILDSVNSAISKIESRVSKTVEDLYSPLTDLHIRFSRISTRFNCKPSVKWWERDKSWNKVWKAQEEAFALVYMHFESLLKKAGISQIPTLGKPFDSSCMTAIEAVDREDVADGVVIEEISSGYIAENNVIRYAEVKVSRNKGK